MDNIVFEKIWQDGNIIELKIFANSEFVSAYQNCYIQNNKLEEVAEKILNFMGNYNESCYLEFGNWGK